MNTHKIRTDTLGVQKSVYLQNAGSALPPQIVLDTQIQHLKLEAEIGGYKAADLMRPEIEAFYQSAATLICASPEEIAFTTNATDGWQKLFYGFANTLQPGDRILTAKAEYAANYIAFLQVAKNKGVEIDIVSNDENGQLDIKELERMITPQSKLIAITWLPTNGGLINPAAKIGQIANKYNILYLLDACQAVGQMPVDVQSLGCDMLTATGRKFLRGPRGTGFLYIRKEIMHLFEPPMLDLYGANWTTQDCYQLRGDARRFELWEKNYAAMLGLGAAIDYALEIGLEPIQERCQMLANYLRAGLRNYPHIVCQDIGLQQSAIVSFSLKNLSAEQFKIAASQKDIAIGVSQPSSTRLDAEERQLPPLVRASPHYYNTMEEIDRLLNLCREVGPQNTLSFPAQL